MAQKDDKLGVDFKKQRRPKKVRSGGISVNPTQLGGSNLSTLANIAQLAATVKSGVGGPKALSPEVPIAGAETVGPGIETGPRVDLPRPSDIRAKRREQISKAVGATVGGEAGDPGTGFRGGKIQKIAKESERPSIQEQAQTAATGFTDEEIRQVAAERLPERKSIQDPAPEAQGLGIQPPQTEPSPTAQSVSSEVLDASGKVIGTKSPTSQEVIPLAKAEPAIGVGEAAVKAGPVPATPEEVDTAIAKREEREPGFFDKLGPEGKQALIRAALSAGTSILEAANPLGAAAIISRGALTGTTAFDEFRGARAKGRAGARKEARTVAGEKREEAKLGLEERRVKVAERAKPVKEADTPEGRIKKAEGEAVKASRAEGGGIEEQLEAAESAREVQEFIEGRGVVEEAGAPAETPGFFGRLFGAEAKPETPPRIRFPRKASASVEKVRRGVEARQKTAVPQGLQQIGTDKRTGRTVFRDAQGNTFLGG